MKNYILSILLFVLLFSCNQKSVIKTEISESQKNYFTEAQKTEKESDIVVKKSFSFDDYNDFELDSIFRLSLDSMIDFLNSTEFEKDTVVENYFTNAMYGQAKFGFPEFVILDSKYLDMMDSVDFGECPMYIYTKKENTFEFSYTLMTTMRSWTIAEMYRQDVNFDDKVDLIISRPLYMASRDVSVFHIFTKQNLNDKIHIASTCELLVNDANKTVISFTDGGNFGTNAIEINKWENDSLVEIRKLEKTSNYQKEGFTLEEFTIKKGKKLRTKIQVLNQDKAEEYFDNYK